MFDALRRVDPVEVAERWREQAAALAQAPPADVPPYLPLRELRRSPAAARIGALASQAGLFPFHFERRAHLPLPSAWVAPGQESSAEPPVWQDGLLPERKTQSFRHDLLLASHHPHHRAKWGTHELCHGLVGFAWCPEATSLFHATAGRVAELLPVALWYGFDEAWLQRCPLHRGDGALFEAHCEACEAAASIPDPHAPRADEHIALGLRLLVRELEAIARTRGEGRIIPHRYATVDLATDGLAYARAHGPRLSSPHFHDYAARFLTPSVDVSPSLDHLTARVVDVSLALLTDRPLQPMAPSPAHGAARWTAQDLAWRIYTAQALSPDHRSAWAPHLDALEAVCEASHDPARAPGAALDDAVANLHHHLDDEALPWGADVLTTGYPLAGLPPDPTPLVGGIATGLPTTWEGLETGRDDLLRRFCADDGYDRRPLAKRFARWLHRRHPGPLAELARWESAATHITPSSIPLTGPAATKHLRLTHGWQVFLSDLDVLSLAERVLDGRLGFDGPSLRVHSGEAPPAEPYALLIGPSPDDGEPVVLDVDPATAKAIQRLPLGGGALASLPPEEVDALCAHGALSPVSFAETHSDRPDTRDVGGLSADPPC